MLSLLFGFSCETASGLFMMLVDFLCLMVVYLMLWGVWLVVDFFCLPLVGVWFCYCCLLREGFWVGVNSVVYSLVTPVWVCRLVFWVGCLIWVWYCFVDCYGCWVGDLVIWNWFGWLLCFCLCFCLYAGCGPCIGCFSCSLVMFAGG